MTKILAFVETRDSRIRHIAREVVTAARGVAEDLGGTVDALLAGGPGAATEALNDAVTYVVDRRH